MDCAVRSKLKLSDSHDKYSNLMSFFLMIDVRHSKFKTISGITLTVC